MALQQAPPPVVVPGTSFIVKEGWLVKQGGKYKTWKKRWFVLKNNHISYHKEPSKEPVGRITFSIVSSTSVAPDWDKKVKNKSHFRIHVIDGRSGGAFLIGASDEEDMREWMTAINETLEKYRKAGVGLTAIGSDTKVDKEVPDKDSGEPPPPPPEQKKEMAASQDIRKVRRYTSLQGPSRASTSIQRASRLSTAKLILDSNITKKPSTESFSDDEESDDDTAESPEQMSEEGKSKELYQAVATGNIVNVKAWLQLGVDTNWVNESENNRTALHAAVQRNDARIVADLLAANASVNVQDTLGTTPIQIAAAHGNIDSLNALLAAPKVNLSLLDASNRSATYIAIFTGHKECAERLLELEIANGSNQWDSYHLSAVQNVEAFEGYDPEAANEQFVSPLHVASAFGACKSVKWLLSQSTKTRIKDSLQRTPVHYAAASGSVEVLTELIQSGFSADDRDEYGKNALHFAAGLGRTDVVKELLQRECLGAPDNLDFTPLHIACVQGQAECVELLLENNTDDINVESLDSFTPLFLAAHGGNTNVIDCLLSHKANINQRTATNETPIHEACRRGNTQALELLLKHKANAEAIDINGNSPLLTSIRNCSTACTEILLREGADTQIRNNKKESALSIAVEVEDLDTINLLLEQGMDCNETLADGGTILFIAAEKGNKAIVKLLLNCGAEPDAENKAKETPVFKGIAAGHPDIVELLMEVGANPNHKTKSGLTPLLEAARLDRVECLEILLACGALTTARNEQKETALHLAAAVGSVRAMSRLLLFGASLAACNNKRKTPLQVAAENGHKLAALLCIANGASVPPHSLPLMGDLVESLLQSGDKEFSVRKRKDSSAKRRRHKKLKKRSVDSSSKLLASSSGDISAPPEVPDLATPSLDNLPGNTALESVVDSPSPLEDKSEANVSNPPDVPTTDAPAISRPDVPAPSPPEADAPTPPEASAPEVNAPIPPETDAPAISRPDVPAPSPPEADAPTPPEASAPKPTPVESAVPPVRREPDEPDHVFAKRFMKRAQQVLTKPNYKQFYQLLRQYKEETIQPNELFEKIAEILSSPDTLDLLENFQTFLPDEQKENYARYISSMSGINNS